MAIKPLGTRVLLKEKEALTKTATGLFIPETAQEKTSRGSIVDMGECEHDTLKVNDNVIYDKYAGTPLKIDEKEHLIIDVNDIIAIIGNNE